MNKNKSIPTIFLDRDGTINQDHGYVYKINNFQFINGAIEAMLELKRIGYALVIVTNQSGIAKRLFTELQFLKLTEWMYCYLISRGVKLDGIFYCPHHPKAIEPKYKEICNCRKPNPGMLLNAQHKLNIDMRASYMVGDKISDMQASKKVSIGTNILISGGKPTINYINHEYTDFIINSLIDLPKIIKSNKSK